MPGLFQTSSAGVPNTIGLPAVHGFMSGDSPVFEYPFAITGVTKNSAGAALGACVVTLFRTADNSLVSQITSDGSGSYRIDASPLLQHYLVAYKAGGTDVAGTSVNTIVGT